MRKSSGACWRKAFILCLTLGMSLLAVFSIVGSCASADSVTQATKSVVHLIVQGTNWDADFSGIIMDKQGYVLSYWNGVEILNPGPIVGILTITADGQAFPTVVVHEDSARNLVLLKVDTGSARLPVATLGTNTDIIAGAPAIAIGYSMDKGPPPLTLDVVRNTLVGLEEVEGHTYVVSNGFIRLGMGGGALITPAGKVIGIITGEVPMSSTVVTQPPGIPPIVSAALPGDEYPTIPIDEARAFFEKALGS